MRVLYFTYCCAKKDDSLKGTGKKVSPLELYKATPTQRFMRRCIEAGVEWAIFSDKYAFVFPESRISWYEKHPCTLTYAEKRKLFDDAFKVLKDYDFAHFYYNPGRLHPFYRELIDEMRRKGKNIREITHLDAIFWGAYMQKKLKPILKKTAQHSSMVLLEYISESMPNGAISLRFFSYGSNMNEEKVREDTRKKGYEFGLENAERRILEGYKRVLGNISANHGLAFTICPSEERKVEGICHDVPIEGIKAFLRKEGVLSIDPSYELIMVSVPGEDHPVLTLRGLKPSSFENLVGKLKLKAFCYMCLTIEGAKRWNVDYSDILEVKKISKNLEQTEKLGQPKGRLGFSRK